MIGRNELLAAFGAGDRKSPLFNRDSESTFTIWASCVFHAFVVEALAG